MVYFDINDWWNQRVRFSGLDSSRDSYSWFPLEERGKAWGNLPEERTKPNRVRTEVQAVEKETPVSGNPLWAVGDEQRADGRWMVIYCTKCTTRLLEAHESATQSVVGAYFSVRHFCPGAVGPGREESGVSLPGKTAAAPIPKDSDGP